MVTPTDIQLAILSKVDYLIKGEKESQTLCNIEWFMRDWCDEKLGAEK